MHTLKISLLVFILSITISAQQDNFLSSEKTLSTSFIIQTIDNLDQMLRQEVNLIINKLNNNHLASENYLIDSMISESVTGAKVKFLFEYNIDDKIIERTGFNNDLNGNWHLIEKDEYFYDTHYNLIREIYLDWNNATWDSSLQILYEHNQNYKRISTTIQSYVTSNWENEVRTTYTYNQMGNEITSLTELWQNNKWTNSGRDYSYYSSENRRDSILFQIWDGNDWQNYLKTSFYYDSLTTFLNLAFAQLWSGNQFQDYLKLNIINDELGNQLQQLQEIWNGSAWVNDLKLDYTYVWNYFESCNSELWNGANWEPGDSPIIVNNPDGFNIAIIAQSIHIYYIIVNVESTNSNTLKDFSLSQNYPNPFNPSTKIKYSIPSVTLRQAQSDIKVTLRVYDILGRDVATLVNEQKPAGEYEVEFNGSNLPSGIYFYQLKAGEYSETRKMVLLK